MHALDVCCRYVDSAPNIELQSCIVNKKDHLIDS